MTVRESLWARTDQFIIDEIRRKGGEARTPIVIGRDEWCNRMMAVYRNDHGALVDESLRSMFVPENYASLRLHLHTSTNILLGILDETAICYQEPPTRYIKGAKKDDRAVRATVTGTLASLLDLDDLDILDMEDDTEDEGEKPKKKPKPFGGAPAGEPENEEPDEEPEPEPEPEDDGEGEGEDAIDPIAKRAQSSLEKLLSVFDLDGVMEEAHRLARVLPAVWLMPVVRPDPQPDNDKKMRLDVDVYTPVNSGVDTDPKDDTQAIAFWTWRTETLDNGQTRKVKYRWTATEFTKHLEDGSQVVNDLASDNVNVLGRLPITVVRLRRPLDSYYIDGQGQDLYEATMEACILRTLQNARFRDSSFKQIVIDGEPDKMPADQLMGNPAQPIFTPEGQASVLDLEANLQQQTDAIHARIEDVVVRHGVSPSQWSLSEKSQSGFSKKMDQAKVLKMNRKERKFLANAERDLFHLLAIVLDQFPVPEIGKLDGKAELVIDFVDPVFEEEPLTQARADAINLRLGLTNLVEIIMRNNPELTPLEAVKRLVLNRKIEERFGSPKTESLLDALTQVQGNAGAGANVEREESGFGKKKPPFGGGKNPFARRGPPSGDEE